MNYCFGSTSKERAISLGYAECALGKTDTVDIVFKISIDPSVLSVPFTSVYEVTYLQSEEILFSMHTVFRVGEIIKIDDNSSLYQVELILTSDDDQQLHTLIKRIQTETRGRTGWSQLGVLLLTIGQFDKAEKLYELLLEQTFDENDEASYYN